MFSRLFWLVAVLTSVGVLSYVLIDRFEHYLSHPVVVNVEVKEMEEIPFPTVTVCNQNAHRYIIITYTYCQILIYG